MRALERRARRESPLQPLEALGFDGDATEAQAFAFLAVRALDGKPLSYPLTTGVPRPLSGRPDKPTARVWLTPEQAFSRIVEAARASCWERQTTWPQNPASTRPESETGRETRLKLLLAVALVLVAGYAAMVTSMGDVVLRQAVAVVRSKAVLLLRVLAAGAAVVAGRLRASSSCAAICRGSAVARAGERGRR